MTATRTSRLAYFVECGLRLATLDGTRAETEAAIACQATRIEGFEPCTQEEWKAAIANLVVIGKFKLAGTDRYGVQLYSAQGASWPHTMGM